MDYHQGAPLTSLDLIEECLTDIYRTRKASLRDKARITEKKIKKRREQHTAVKQVSHFFEDDDSDEDTKAAAKKTTAPSPRPLSNPPTPRQNKFATIEDKENDAIAMAAYESFRSQLCNWYTKNPTKRQDDEHRAEIADFLTEQYMCQQLDPLPPSRGVTSVRRQMCRVIEDFASTGELPPDFAEWLASQQPQEMPSAPAAPVAQISLASEKSKAKLDTKERPLDVIRGTKKQALTVHQQNESEVKPKEKMNETTKAMLEKQRIKEQYEAYMKHTKKKQQTEQSNNKSDNSAPKEPVTQSNVEQPTKSAPAMPNEGAAVPTEEEYEQHLAEIRSLISSIKDNKS